MGYKSTSASNGFGFYAHSDHRNVTGWTVRRKGRKATRRSSDQTQHQLKQLLSSSAMRLRALREAKFAAFVVAALALIAVTPCHSQEERGATVIEGDADFQPTTLGYRFFPYVLDPENVVDPVPDYKRQAVEFILSDIDADSDDDVEISYNYAPVGAIERAPIMSHNRASKLIYVVKGCLCVEIAEENGFPLTNRPVVRFRLASGQGGYIPFGLIHTRYACPCARQGNTISDLVDDAEFFEYLTELSRTTFYPEALDFGRLANANFFNYPYHDVTKIFEPLPFL